MADTVQPIRQAQQFYEHSHVVQSLATGEAITVVALGLIRFTVIPGSGATVTVSKVDSPGATSHDSDTEETTTAEKTYDVKYPYYRISTASGSARIGFV